MKLNWKVRFKNKVWLGMFLSLIVGFIFNMLKLFEVYPPFTENWWIRRQPASMTATAP